ncbi:MAG: hypothetical protein ISS93_01300 [Candidatus Aenigmarchaeota archaeon]|nr:hypothetical protein [Candidatus Aenigmarchaeota archaeon]
MRFSEIKKIMKENKKWLDMLEEYDRTGHLPTEKIRRSFTLKRMHFKKLKEASRKSGRSMSSLLEEMIEKGL